jgi:Cu(I)/Ag(I) efflux system membrane fusion protein/cobalt-zinc-cadmium efflux system membrane fusion protein
MIALLLVLLLTLGSVAAAETPQAQPPSSPAGEQLYTCGMHPQVIRDHPGTCPICGMELTPLKHAGSAPQAERKILYWWDPMMSPPYISDKPGKSPMGMDLVPVYEDQVAAGPAVIIDPTIVQNMGVRVATAAEGPLQRTLRAVGYLAEAQPNQHDINLRVSGWIEKLYADVEGMHLQAGAPLFDLYSPELQVAIEELIAARRSRQGLGARNPLPAPPPRPEMAAGEGIGGEGIGGRTSDALVTTAERKLELLGLSRAQVRELGKLERAPATITFRSPLTGHLVEKPIVDGSAVQAGMRVLRIVDHSSLWLDIAIFEQQLPFVHLGQTVRISVLAFPGQAFDGTISFIHPHVDPMTRTVMARVVVTNPELQLRPGMYATAEIDSELVGRALLVPRDAVIDTGTKQVVFVARPQGHFDPRRVTVGVSGSDDKVQILAGLAPGEQVVTSGQFLLDAESRFREAIRRFLEPATENSPQRGAEEGATSPGVGHVH